MDHVDRKILKCLKENSRQTASAIGQAIHLSVSAVIERIRKLELKGIVQSYTVILDQKQLGNDLTAFVSVCLEHPKYSKAFAQAAVAHEDIAECHHIAGDMDYLMKIITDSSSSLELIHRDIKRMPGVSRMKTFYVLSTVKNEFSILPREE